MLHPGKQLRLSQQIPLLKCFGSWVLYGVLALFVILPSVKHLQSNLPTGPTNVVTVPLLNTWVIWWNIDRASHGFSGYWNAPIFCCTDGAFAFSEPQPATLMVAPVYWATGSLLIAYKAYLLLSFVMNGAFTARLCRRMKIGNVWAIAAGAMMVWLPISLRRMDVVQLIPVWGILWTWDAAWQHCRRPTYRSGLTAAVACGMSFAMSIHHGLFMIIVLVPCLLLCMPWRRVLASWKQNVVSVAVCGVLVGAMAIPMRSIMQKHEFERSEKTVSKLSARPSHFLRLPPEALIGTPASKGGMRLSPGWTKLLLAFAGLAAGLLRMRRRRWTCFLLCLTLVSAGLALGPNLTIGEWKPWWAISNTVPGLRQARSILRFAYLTQMAIILLSAIGLSELWLRVIHRFKKRWLASLLVTIFAVLAVIELPPPKSVVAGVPNLANHQNWTSYVKRNIPSDGRAGIVCLPFASGNKVTDFAVTTRWMYYGTLHGVPLLNGYSGFFPEDYFAARMAEQQQGLSDEVLALFVAAKVHFVVVRSDYLPHATITKRVLKNYRLELVFEDPVGINIYKLSQISSQSDFTSPQ